MLLYNKDRKEKGWKVITEEEKKLLPLEEQERVLYLDGKLKEKLDFAKKQINKNNDSVGIVTGDEGSGKSALGGNIMRYMTNDNFIPQVQMIGSDFDEAIDKIESAKQKDCRMFDEAVMFLLAIEVMKTEHKNLLKIFSIIRQKNLFVLILIPSFFRLSSYFALDRSRFLIRTYTKNGERGYFAYYGTKKKEKLYRLGRQNYNNNAVSPTIRGRFFPCATLESEEYKKFKLRTLTKSLTSARKKKQLTTGEIIKLRNKEIIKSNLDKPTEHIAGLLHISERRVRQVKKQTREDNLLK